MAEGFNATERELEILEVRKENALLRYELEKAKGAIRAALTIAESEWIFEGAHPMRQAALERMRSAVAGESA